METLGQDETALLVCPHTGKACECQSGPVKQYVSTTVNGEPGTWVLEVCGKRITKNKHSRTVVNKMLELQWLEE